MWVRAVPRRTRPWCVCLTESAPGPQVTTVPGNLEKFTFEHPLVRAMMVGWSVSVTAMLSQGATAWDLEDLGLGAGLVGSLL